MKKESSQNNVVELVGEKSHRNVTNVTLEESFVCLFLERPKENKRPLPSLSVPMKILPSLSLQKRKTLGMHGRREGVNQDHGVEILVNKNRRNRPKVQI